MAQQAKYAIYVTAAGRYGRWVQADVLRAAARAALRQQGARAPAALTVRVTGDTELRDLNRDYLGEDQPTDVLSFPSGEMDPETGRHYLGDIAVSYPRASAQARQGRHPVQAELQLLTVHGVLHLLGHDHGSPAEQARMWAAQAEILRRLRAPIRGPAGAQA
jgi:probable rRNA maturation factor